MTGYLNVKAKLTRAQWDVLLAALSRAEDEWTGDADASPGTWADLSRRNVATLQRARAALTEGNVDDQ